MDRICSLFSGIGGFELGFERSGFSTVMMCEIDPLAQALLSKRFPTVALKKDVTKLRSLPPCEVLVAGWPCQDLSQAGRMAGLAGSSSGLVSEIFRLVKSSRRRPDYIVLENVAFALYLQRGRALHFVIEELEALGYSWAYRVLDTRFFGLPQRRRRLYIVASRVTVAASVLFDIPCAEIQWDNNRPMVGFYWTEGNTGIGWSPGAFPPLKSGSGLSIPSPPALWDRRSGKFFIPGIVDAERIQGFEGGWTDLGNEASEKSRSRWRLVGNAVSVPVAKWIAGRIQVADSSLKLAYLKTSKAPNCGFGSPNKQSKFFYAPEAPTYPIISYIDSFGMQKLAPLSYRAANGFLTRFTKSTLRQNKEFVDDLSAYVNSDISSVGDISQASVCMST